MKKTLSFIILANLLFLTSCKVNWFDRQYDVPWWMVAIPIAIFYLVIIGTVGKYIMSKKYVCPKCGLTFSPKGWGAFFSLHIGTDRLLKCPHCGEKSFCHISREK